MGTYIVCNKKRNSPRISTRICKEKCSQRDECEEYSAYFSVPVNKKNVPLSPQGDSLTHAGQ